MTISDAVSKISVLEYLTIELLLWMQRYRLFWLTNSFYNTLVLQPSSLGMDISILAKAPLECYQFGDRYRLLIIIMGDK